MTLTKIIQTISIIGITSLFFSLPACKKKKTETTDTPAPANGTVMLHLHTDVDTNEVAEYNTVYTMTGGRKISVSIAQLYISSIQLVKIDGSTLDINGVTIAKTMQTEQYLLGSVPSGNYKSIRFNVGLSAGSNSVLPVSSDSTFNKPNMWFGTNAQPWQGYVFVNFQGKIDTSNAGSGTLAQMVPFSYRIGTNSHLKGIALPDQNYSVLPDQTQFIHIIIDYGKLLAGIKLNASANLNVNSVADNAGSLSNQIANNIPLMFRYE